MESTVQSEQPGGLLLHTVTTNRSGKCKILNLQKTLQGFRNEILATWQKTEC